MHCNAKALDYAFSSWELFFLFALDRKTCLLGAMEAEQIASSPVR